MDNNSVNFIELTVLGLKYSRGDKESNALVLKEKHGDRRIQIVIGTAEAQSIECVLRNVRPPRPLTHDLMEIIINTFNIRLAAVVIDMLPGGIFGGTLIFDEEDDQKMIDSRSSDAIALALRTNAKIYIHPALIDAIGIMADDESGDKEIANKRAYNNNLAIKRLLEEEPESIESLEKRLRKAIETENYEEAGRIKAEITRRRSASKSSEP